MAAATFLFCNIYIIKFQLKPIKLFLLFLFLCYNGVGLYIGERNERIRTYNYPQNRVTDHRIGYTTLNLPKIIDGDLDDLLHALEEANQKDMLEEETKKLKEMNFESTDNQ